MRNWTLLRLRRLYCSLVLALFIGALAAGFLTGLARAATTDDSVVESITAYGKYWNFDMTGNPWAGNGSSLSAVARYATGPCAGKVFSICKFDTRTYVTLNGALAESITAYGRYWNFDAAGNPWAGNGSDLTTVARYATGPCAGKTVGTCKFDSRTFRVIGGVLTEAITAYGRYWNFDAAGNPLAGNGSDLTTVARYATGPCKGKTVGTCTFDARTFVPGTTLAENFDFLPYCLTTYCLTPGTSLTCGKDFGYLTVVRVDAGNPTNTCIQNSASYSGQPSAGHVLVDTSGTAEAFYTKFDAVSRNQTAEVLFRFEGALSPGTHMVVATHARWFPYGGPTGSYNSGFAVGAGMLDGVQQFFLEDLSPGTIIAPSVFPYNFNLYTWYKVRIDAHPDPAHPGYYAVSYTAWVYGTSWQQVAQKAVLRPEPTWLNASENGGGMVGAVVNSNQIEFDQFSLTSY